MSYISLSEPEAVEAVLQFYDRGKAFDPQLVASPCLSSVVRSITVLVATAIFVDTADPAIAVPDGDHPYPILIFVAPAVNLNSHEFRKTLKRGRDAASLVLGVTG